MEIEGIKERLELLQVKQEVKDYVYREGLGDFDGKLLKRNRPNDIFQVSDRNRYECPK